MPEEQRNKVVGDNTELQERLETSVDVIADKDKSITAFQNTLNGSKTANLELSEKLIS